MTKQKQKPHHEIRLGRIKASIWENQTENGSRYNVTIARLYKTNGDWQSSASLGRDDLLLAAKVLDMAHTWLFEQTTE
jgi:hypothetical protein